MFLQTLMFKIMLIPLLIPLDANSVIKTFNDWLLLISSSIAALMLLIVGLGLMFSQDFRKALSKGGAVLVGVIIAVAAPALVAVVTALANSVPK